jgi:dCMP deaminase
MQPGIDLSPIYTLRSNFTIIGLTGRTGSGYADIAKQLTKGFNKEDYPAPNSFDLSHNSYKKYKIAYNYASENFKKFTLIRYRDVITLFLTKFSFDKFIAFLDSAELESFFSTSKIKVEYDFTEEKAALLKLKTIFNDIHSKFRNIKYEDERSKEDWTSKLNELFLSSTFQNFSNKFHSALQKSSFVRHNILMELLTINMRRSGNPYNADGRDSNNLFSIAKLINYIIKAIRKSNKNNPTKIIIDS